MARRTAAEAEQTRKKLLAIARESFTTRGYAGTATNDIVTAAGLTRGAMYHHFDDKADLFRAVFLDVINELNERVITAALTGTNAREAFAAGCRACIEVMAGPEYHQIASVDAPVVLGQAEWHRLDTGVGMASMRAGLEALVAEGFLPDPPTHALTIALFGGLTELGLAVSRGDLTVDEAADGFEDLINRL